MANEHPFQILFETLGRVPTAHAESVNRQAYEILSDILTVPVERVGRCILLRAPRAGHGKTHLLSRIQHQLGASHEFVPLQSSFGCRIDAASVTDDTLRRLVRQLPASGGLTVLDLVTRRLFASALQPLVASGEVPCQDRDGALNALRTRPIETFDFNHPNAVTAHWARENFEVLGHRLSLELAQRSDLPVSGISFWVDALFQFASAPLESSNRVRVLAESMHAGTGVEMERLEALLGLVTLLMRVVLVADDLEGFSTDETAALRLAAFLGSLRQSVERLDVILSLNQDIWQNAFMPRLSGGLADRLSEVVVELEPLTESEMEALLNSRVPGLGRRILDRMDVGAAGTHARGLIREAGIAWLKATAMDSAPAAPLAAPAVASISVAQPPVIPVIEPAPILDPTVFSPSEPVKLPESVMEWPAPVFAPPSAVEIATEPLAYQPPLESPFQRPDSPSFAEPVYEATPAPQWQEPSEGFTPNVNVSSPAYEWMPPVQPQPASTNFVTPVDSPFQEFAPQTISDSLPPFSPPPIEYSPPYHPVSEPIFDAPAIPVAAPPSPTPEETDRVDDLLRQFRERYGRGSL